MNAEGRPNPSDLPFFSFYTTINMQKLFKVTFIVLILITALSIISFTAKDTNLANGSVIENIQNSYRSNFALFRDEVSKLSLISEKHASNPNDANQKLLQNQVSQTRLAYKKIEFLIEYLDPEMTVKYINGAPLPKLMKHVPEITVIEPNGLQTIDELAFLDPESERETITELSKSLLKITDKAYNYQKNKKLEYRFVIEAIRYGILRVFTLGLTGFDTPGSGNGIAEAAVSMQSMRDAFELFNGLSNLETKMKFDQILNSFDTGILYLQQNENFDTFDRLHFLTTYVNPLYEYLLDFQKLANVELKKEADPTLYPHNYESKKIFDADFFNPAYYTQIAASDLYDPKKIELGKLLFFDPILSRDINMSCATCHNPKKGFADGLPKSKTTKAGVTTDRHSPTLLNAALYGRYFWDMREYDLERQIKHVVHNELEFNIDFIELADRLKQSSTYLSLFEEAYGARDKYKISTWSISNALAAYVNSLTSYNSNFDKYARGETKSIAPEVKAGFNLFMGKAACGTCHFAPSFSGLVPPFYADSESEVLGITTDFDTIHPKLDTDPGRVANGLAEEEADHYYRSMKTVTVRNAEITAPYMHNGSLETLEEVMHFYNQGGGAGMGLDISNQTLPDTHLGLTKEEIGHLIAFVESLTDAVGIDDIPSEFPAFEHHPEWNQRSSY